MAGPPSYLRAGRLLPRRPGARAWALSPTRRRTSRMRRRARGGSVRVRCRRGSWSRWARVLEDAVAAAAPLGNEDLAERGAHAQRSAAARRCAGSRRGTSGVHRGWRRVVAAGDTRGAAARRAAARRGHPHADLAGRTSTVKNVRGRQCLACPLALAAARVPRAGPGRGIVRCGIARDGGPRRGARRSGPRARRPRQGRPRAGAAPLREELADAERAGDRERAIQARAELEAIGDRLSVAAVGPGGRDRRAGDPSERARAAVTKAIRALSRASAARIRSWATCSRARCAPGRSASTRRSKR